MSEDGNDGGSAFPLPDLIVEGHVSCGSKGMSLLDWFAGKALQGILAAEDKAVFSYEMSAEMAYKHAIAMLKERERIQSGREK